MAYIINKCQQNEYGCCTEKHDMYECMTCHHYQYFAYISEELNPQIIIGIELRYASSIAW
jgi:hypothetical protein